MDHNSRLHRCTYLSCPFTPESHFSPGRQVFQCRQKEIGCRDTGDSREEKIENDYDSQPSGPEGGPSSVPCRTDQVKCSAMRMLLVVVRRSGPLSLNQMKSVCQGPLGASCLDFQTFFCELQSKKTAGSHRSWSIYWSIHLSKWIFLRYIKSLTECSDLHPRSIRELM